MKSEKQQLKCQKSELLTSLEKRTLIDALHNVKTAKRKEKLAWLYLSKMPVGTSSTYRKQRPGEIGQINSWLKA